MTPLGSSPPNTSKENNRKKHMHKKNVKSENRKQQTSNDLAVTKIEINLMILWVLQETEKNNKQVSYRSLSLFLYIYIYIYTMLSELSQTFISRLQTDMAATSKTWPNYIYILTHVAVVYCELYPHF